MTDEQAKKTFERALKMDHEFGEYFTGNIFEFKKTIWNVTIIFLKESFKVTLLKKSTVK